MSNIRIDIASEFKDKGFKKADKAATGLQAQFDRLGKTIATVFSVQAVTRFAQAAVQGFAEDEKAAARFEQALKGVNLGFATPEIVNYLDNLEKQSGVLKDDLLPAFQSLAQTTRSVYKSQDILNTAIDASAGSGYDLNTVIRDLTRSYLGNNAGLAKYNLGLSKAELKTTSFEKVQELLNKQFSGQRAAYLQTYAGKVDLITVSYDRMSDAIGEGLVDAFGMLAGENGIGGATTAMEKFGIMAADAIRGIGVIISNVQSRIPFLDQLQYLSQFPQAMKLLDKLMGLGKAERPLFFPSAGIGQPGVDKRLAAIEEAAIKRQKELEALRLKSLRAQEKANRLKRISIMLMEKEKKFDLTRTQLNAALQGKLTAEEEKRVKELLLIEDIKQAIAEQDVDKAEKLMDELKKVQDQTTVLADSLLNLEAGNPFSKWGKYFEEAKQMLRDLYAAMANNQAILDSLTKDINAGRSKNNAAVIAAKTDKALTYREAADASAEEAARAKKEAQDAQDAAEEALRNAKNEEERRLAEEFARAAAAAAEAAALLEESVGAAYYAAALADEALANEYLNQSIESSAGLYIPEVSINVNVAGNVTAEADLADYIYTTFLNYQKSGKAVLMNSVAL